MTKQSATPSGATAPAHPASLPITPPRFKKKSSLTFDQISRILTLAGQGKTSKDISDDTGIEAGQIRRLCRASAIFLTPIVHARKLPVRKEPPPPGVLQERAKAAERTAKLHPLEFYRKELSLPNFARHVVKDRLSSHRGVEYLDGGLFTTYGLYQAANRILKAEGLAQIGGHETWV